MGERRRRFTWEFEVKAVRLVHESGKPRAQVARELAIRPDIRSNTWPISRGRRRRPAALAACWTPRDGNPAGEGSYDSESIAAI